MRVVDGRTLNHPDLTKLDHPDFVNPTNIHSTTPRAPFEPNQPKQTSLESTLQLFLAQQTKTNADNDRKFREINTSLQQMNAHNKMIETQLA